MQKSSKVINRNKSEVTGGPKGLKIIKHNFKEHTYSYNSKELVN